MKKLIFICLVLFNIISCTCNVETNEYSQHDLPKEAIFIREYGKDIYFKIGNRYYVRHCNPIHEGYTVYEVDKSIAERK